MAESEQSKGLGELFVEFGQKGGSGLMKSLNGISAQFLLTKNTAQQAVNLVKDFSKNALNTTVSMDKFSSVTGISAENLQKWNVWLKLNNYSTEQFLGNLKSLQENMLDVQMGRGNLKGWTLLGLDPHNFDFKKPDEALAAILKRLQQVNEATGALALREMGLSQDLLYLAKQANNQFDERLLLTDKELENLRKQQAGWNALGATWQAAQNKFIANQQWINNLLEITNKLLSYPWQNKEEKQYTKTKAKNFTINANNSLQSWIWKDNFISERLPAPLRAAAFAQSYLLEKFKSPEPQKPKEQHNITSPLKTQPAVNVNITNRGTVGNTMPTPFYTPVNTGVDNTGASRTPYNLIPVDDLNNQPSTIPEKLPPVPNNLTSYNTSNVININQTINSTADASLVANESANSIRRSLSRVELINPQVV